MTIALIGDGRILDDGFDSNPKINIMSRGHGSLPVWDVELKDIFDEAISGTFEKIYFSCGHPFMGCQKVKDILALSDESLLTFSQEERAYFDQKKYMNLSDNEINKLCDKYIEYIDFFIGLDQRIKLLPISILWHEKLRKSRLRMPPIYDKLKQFPLLDIELLLKSKFDFISRKGKLHPKAIEKIIAFL